MHHFTVGGGVCDAVCEICTGRGGGGGGGGGVVCACVVLCCVAGLVCPHRISSPLQQYCNVGVGIMQ